MTTVPGPDGGRRRRLPSAVQVWRAHRWAALACWVAILVAAGVTRVHVEDTGDLREGLRDGSVTQVRIEGAIGGPDGIGPHSEGVATVRLVWDEGWHRSRAEVVQATSTRALEAVGGAEGLTLPVVTGRVDDALTAVAPAVRLSWGPAPPDTPPNVFGWELPFSCRLLVPLLCYLYAMAVTGCPEPRFATRWAWFWLALSPLSVLVVPAFLLAGARRPVGRAPRVTGLAALIATVLLHAVLP